MTRDEIAAELKVANNGYLGDILTDLVYCDFLRAYHVKGSRTRSGLSIYKLVDFYTIFYHTFIRKSAEPGYWLRMQGTPTVNTWNGLAYERVCMSHVAQIKRSLGIANVTTETYACTVTDGESKSPTPPTLITTFGLAHGMYADSIHASVVLDDLFA
jgi:hypothetical protein